MAKTTHLVLFGPIFVAAAPPIAYFIDYNYICYKYQLVFQKKKEEKLTYGPNDDRHVCLGPFSSSPPFPSCMSQITIHICYKHQLVFKKKEKKLTYGPNNARCIVQACFHCHCPSCCLFHRLQLYIHYKRQLV